MHGLQVERYFRSNGQLPSPGYWMGALRESASESYGLVDGTAVQQVRLGTARCCATVWLRGRALLR